jgi:hypothetical protein
VAAGFRYGFSGSGLGALGQTSASLFNLSCDPGVQIAQILFTHGAILTNHIGYGRLDEVVESFFLREADLVFIAELVDEEGGKLIALLLLLKVH